MGGDAVDYYPVDIEDFCIYQQFCFRVANGLYMHFL